MFVMVSVCIATYNGEKYIYKQLKSILDQLDISDEIVISDNGSSDRTIEIIKSFNDNRINILYLNKKIYKYSIYNKNHYNISKNFENAILKSTGKYIFLADQDDIWKPNKKSIVLSYLADYSLVMHDCILIDQDNKLQNDSFFKLINTQKGFFKNIINPTYHGCSMAFNAELKSIILPFPKHVIMHDAWIGLLNEALRNVKFIDDKLILYRKTSSSSSGDSIHSNNCIVFKIYYRVELFFQLVFRIIKIKV